MAVPYTFGTATSSIPLSQLDSNFATAITLGSTNVYLGNTTTTLVGFANLSSTLITSPTHNSGTTLSLQTGGTTGLYIDASQNVGIGTTSPSYKLDVSGNGRIGSATISASPSTGGAYIELGQDRTGDGVSYIDFHSSSGTDYEGRIIRESGLNGNFDIVNSGTGSITFSNNSAERMRIDSSGNLLVGTTSAILSNSNSVGILPGQGLMFLNHASGTASGAVYEYFAYNGTPIGNIQQSGTTAVIYSTTSDYRLKKNVQLMTTGLSVIGALKPVTYDWIGVDEKGEGFIAHELQEFVPLAVTGQKDAVDADGKPILQGVDYSKIVVHLVAALQELDAKFEAYKAAHP